MLLMLIAHLVKQSGSFLVTAWTALVEVAMKATRSLRETIVSIGRFDVRR